MGSMGRWVVWYIPLIKLVRWFFDESYQQQTSRCDRRLLKSRGGERERERGLTKKPISASILTTRFNYECFVHINSLTHPPTSTFYVFGCVKRSKVVSRLKRASCWPEFLSFPSAAYSSEWHIEFGSVRS